MPRHGARETGERVGTDCKDRRKPRPFAFIKQGRIDAPQQVFDRFEFDACGVTLTKHNTGAWRADGTARPRHATAFGLLVMASMRLTSSSTRAASRPVISPTASQVCLIITSRFCAASARTAAS